MDTITNEQTPDHMSEVVGRWVGAAQDAMPAEVRNSARWKALLPLAAGTGRKHEKERLALVLGWMWDTVLPAFQPAADECGFGAQWRQMVVERTADAAAQAAKAAVRAAAQATKTARPAEAAEWAAWAADMAEKAQKAKQKAKAAALAVQSATTTAWALAQGQTRTQRQAEAAAVWAQFDPCTLLERLVAVSAP